MWRTRAWGTMEICKLIQTSGSGRQYKLVGSDLGEISLA